MAITNRRRSPKLSPWAVKVENYLLLLRKEEKKLNQSQRVTYGENRNRDSSYLFALPTQR